LHPSFGTGED